MRTIKLKQLCPEPRVQVPEPSTPVPPDWLQVPERRSRKKVIDNDNHSKVDLLKFVENTNKFVRQKRGGTKEAPIVPDSSYCIICSDGDGICLGQSCKGKRRVPVPVPELLHLAQPHPKLDKKVLPIPGLMFVENSCSKGKKR